MDREVCVFYEKWSDANEQKELDEVAINEEKELPKELIFRDIVDYNTSDDLSGKALVPELVTEAKREELTEVYRRGDWKGSAMEDCIRETWKPPMPIRWVVTNKGDDLHPNVRCRSVAKHLVAKYGGKDAEDLFVAMPPFEMVKALLV